MPYQVVWGEEALRDQKRCIDEKGCRELFIQFGKGAYVLRYIVAGNAVKILRVWHAKELRTEQKIH